MSGENPRILALARLAPHEWLNMAGDRVGKRGQQEGSHERVVASYSTGCVGHLWPVLFLTKRLCHGALCQQRRGMHLAQSR